MIGGLNLSIINLLWCLSLTTIVYSNAVLSDDHNKDKSLNSHGVNRVQNMAPNKMQMQSFTRQSLPQSFITAKSRHNTTTDNVANLEWDTETKLLERSFSRLKKENEENKCLLDSLKSAILWWSHFNGTLKRTNVHILSAKQQLDLSYFDIASDEEAVKIVCKHLENKQIITAAAFSLAYNNLTLVPFHTLTLMANSLKYLSLRGNPFIDIKANATDHNSTQCVLNTHDVHFLPKHNVYRRLAGNRPLLAWATFPKMPALIELDISYCGIEYLDKEAFKNLTNLRNLYMSHNKILNIPADTFLFTPHLQILDLAFANVYDSLLDQLKESPGSVPVFKFFQGVKIEPNFFNYLPKLIYLDLSHTKLRSSSAAAFSQTNANLKFLSLCYTSFPMFGNSVFGGSSLIGLDLSGNADAIFGLDEHVFANLSHSLMYLFFERSNLRHLAWLRPLKNLHFLALAGNNIKNLCARDFMPLKQLQVLDLSSNHVNNWYFRVFQHNENLRILSLRNNNINFISSAMLTDLSSLIYLSLGSNNFICDCILHDLVDISSINNQLAKCQGNLSLDNNKNDLQMKSIYLPEILQSSKLFSNTSLSSLSLTSLIVTDNLYKFKEIVKKLPQIHQFKENAEMHFILRSLRNSSNSKVCPHENNFTYSYINKKFNSSRLKLQLFDYKEEQYWCYNQSHKETPRRLNCQRAHLMESIEQELDTLTTYVLCSVGSFILITFIATSIYIRRWHIYYYYSSLKSAALLSVFSKQKRANFKNLCDQNPNMVYDIFISYCQSDRDWIVEELMPNIETSGDISVCLHERDFQIGVTILDNIVSSMERSKAMMLIISSNFLLSHWCQFEMQLAHYHILDLNKDNLILVLLEDIPCHKRPKNLQFLMNVKTYIKWPGGKDKANIHPEERKLFWKRIKHTLKSLDLNFLESQV